MKKKIPLFLDQSQGRFSRFVLLSTLLLLLFISFPYQSFSQFSVFSAKAYNTGIAFTADWSELASNGNTYVVGRARSNAFPTTLGAPYGGNTGDGFVTAFDPSGNIIWSRFIGGSAIEEIFGFKMGNGKIYLAMTGASDLPVTDGSMSLSSTSSIIDFTTSNPVWTKPGIIKPAREGAGVYRLLWPGDTRTDKNTKYNGLNNDKDPIIYAVGLATSNNILGPVYRTEDANMDGKVKYNNSDNDKNFILNKILLSNSPVATPNDVLSQHTPN